MISKADEFAMHRSGSAPRAIARLIIGNSMARQCLMTSGCLSLGRHADFVGKRRRPVIGTVVKGRDHAMTTNIQFLRRIAAIGVAALLAAAPTRLSAQQTPQS